MNLRITAAIVLIITSATAAPDVPAFVNGKIQAYTAEGSPKSKGVTLKLSYPEGWMAKEGQGPNIVQKFISGQGGGLECISILIKPLPKEWTPEVIASGFSAEGVNDLLEAFAEGGKGISAKSTKIEGLPAAILEFTNTGERLGLVIKSRTMTCVFPYKSNLISIAFSVNSANRDDDIDQIFEGNRTLFMAIANTISLPEKWK